MTLFFWFVFLLAIMSLVAIPFQKKGAHVALNVVIAVILFIINLFTATYTFGYGKVPPIVEAFSPRLKEGVAYHLIHSERQGNSYVLLMNEFGTYETLAIRWDTEPPELFLLVDGKIVAIQK